MTRAAADDSCLEADAQHAAMAGDPSSSRGRPIRVCAVSFKPCWQDASGRWMSSGGFPLQMGRIASLFDEMTLVIVRARPLAGGLPLPAAARIVPLLEPRGRDFRRKLSVVARLPYYLWKIASSIRGADVVHVPLPGDIPLLALLVALVARKRTIVRYGGSWSSNSQTTLMSRLTKTCMRTFAGGRNVMLAAGDGDVPPAPNITWLYSTAVSSAELERLGPPPRRGLSDPPRLVCIGRLSPEKGIETLVRAMALLARSDSRPPAFVLPTLTIVGDGPTRPGLEALVRELGCEHIITFTGQLERTTLSEVISRSDICVHPSLTESLSKAWLDAMAHGLPVLTSEVGSARAVFGVDGERGWLVPPGDAELLAAALRRVLTAPADWPALRRRCRDYVADRTLETWTTRIGERCAEQWHWSLADGRLRS